MGSKAQRVVTPEGRNNVGSREPVYIKEPDTSPANTQAIWFVPINSLGHTEQKTVDMSEYSDPSRAHQMC